MATRASLEALGALPVGANYPALMLINGLPVLAFDASTGETCQWSMVVPQGISGAWTAVVHYFMASATTGGVAWDVSIMAITDGDAVDLDAASSFDSVNGGNDSAVPGTAGYKGEVIITLSNADSLAAGDWIWVRLARDIADGNDTATGDAYVIGMELRDAA